MVTAPNIPKKADKKVLLLIDWDNLFISLFHDLGPEKIQFRKRIKKMMEWVKTEVGELVGGHGFVFAPEHFSFYDRQICTDNKLKIIICPKEEAQDSAKLRDTVDENLIWFAKLLSDHPEIKYLCLVSGDSDYIDMLKQMKQKGLKISLVIPTINSFSRLTGFVKLADISPLNKKKSMVLLLEGVS